VICGFTSGVSGLGAVSHTGKGATLLRVVSILGVSSNNPVSLINLFISSVGVSGFGSLAGAFTQGIKTSSSLGAKTASFGDGAFTQGIKSLSSLAIIIF
jgi:hypothetical protein